jgi:hypothetical protein
MSRARDLADLGGSADAGGLTGRNLIINGQMTVAQRGTSATTSNYGTVDRWISSYQGGTVTQSQESLTSSDTPYALGFRKFFRQTNTATASGASDLRQMVQIIESQNIANSGWDYTSASSYVTLSLWVRSSVAGKYGFYLLTYDTPNYQFGFTETLAANTWTKVTKTIPGNSNLVFNNDNGQGVAVAPVAWFGTDYTDSTATVDSWVAQDTTKYLPDDLVNWAGTSGATFDITGVQLEVGSTATDFEQETYATTLKKCQRYYELVGTAVYVGATSYGFAGTEYAVNSNWFEIDWKTEKRTDSAVVDFINGFGWSAGPANSGAGRYGAMWYKGSSFIAQVAGDKTGLPIASVSAEL